MADLDNDLINQLTEQFRELNRIMILQNSSTKSGEAASLLHTLSESEKKAKIDYLTNFKNLTKSELEQRLYEIKKSKELNERQREVLTEQLNLEIQRKNIAEQAKQSTKVLIGSLGNLTKAFNDISGDVTRFNSTISTVGDQALAMGKQFGTAGTAVGAFVKSLTFLATVTLEQSQILLKNFDALSSVGATSGLVTKQVMELGHASGYSVANLEKFTKNFTKLGMDLTVLGNNAFLGSQTFAKMTAVGNKTYEAFNRLGISQEQLTEAQTMFVKQTAGVGIALSKSPERLQKASLEYVDMLVKLRDLTGMSVEKTQAAIDAAMADERFNAYLHEKSMERAALEQQAENETNAIRKKELLARADELSAIIKSKTEAGAYVKATDSPEKAAAKLSALATDGAIVINDMTAKLSLGGYQFQEMVDKANKGQSIIRDLQIEEARVTRNNTKMLGGLLYQVGTDSATIQKTFMLDNQARVNLVRMMDSQTEAGRKRIEEQDKALKEQIERRKKEGVILGPDGKEIRDPAKDLQNSLNTAGKNLATALDNAVDFINPFTGSLGGATLAVGALAGAAYLAAGALGIKGLTGVIGKLLGRIGTAGAAAGAGAAAAGAGAGAGAAAAGAGAGAAAARFAKGVAVPVIIAGAAGAAVDTMVGKFGFGKDEVDKEQDDKNWERMSVFEKAQSGIARRIEDIGEFMFLDNMAKQARIDRIAKETKYFQERDRKTTSPTSLTGKSDTTSTIAEGGQKAVNVNIIGSIPLKVNIEKVLDPLFRLSRATTGTEQKETRTEEDDRFKEIVRDATNPRPSATPSAPSVSVPIPSQESSSKPAEGGAHTVDTLKALGLNLRQHGDVHVAGKKLEANLIEMAKFVQKLVPDAKFTGFNDQFHQEKAPTSLHTKGRAFDFTSERMQQDPKYRSQIMDLIKKQGGFPIDEYSSPSKHAIGRGHIHVAVPATKDSEPTTAAPTTAAATPAAAAPATAAASRSLSVSAAATPAAAAPAAATPATQTSPKHSGITGDDMLNHPNFKKYYDAALKLSPKNPVGARQIAMSQVKRDIANDKNQRNATPAAAAPLANQDRKFPNWENQKQSYEIGYTPVSHLARVYPGIEEEFIKLANQHNPESDSQMGIEIHEKMLWQTAKRKMQGGQKTATAATVAATPATAEPAAATPATVAATPATVAATPATAATVAATPATDKSMESSPSDKDQEREKIVRRFAEARAREREAAAAIKKFEEENKASASIGYDVLGDEITVYKDPDLQKQYRALKQQRYAAGIEKDKAGQAYTKQKDQVKQTYVYGGNIDRMSGDGLRDDVRKILALKHRGVDIEKFPPENSGNFIEFGGKRYSPRLIGLYEHMIKKELEEEASNLSSKDASTTEAQPQKFAKGGMILGPGTSTSDSVPAFNKDTGQPIALSTGEYVLPAGVTSILGKGYLDSLISSPNTLKRQSGGSITGGNGKEVISDSDLGAGMREVIYADGSRKLSGGFGTKFFDPKGNLVKMQLPSFGGVSQTAYPSGKVDTSYSAGPMNVSKLASGRIEGEYDTGLAKLRLGSTPDAYNKLGLPSKDASFGMSVATPTGYKDFNYSREEMMKATADYNRQKSEDNLGLQSNQLVDPMREILTPMLDKQDETNKNMLSVLQNMLSVLESSTSIQSNMLNYARM